MNEYALYKGEEILCIGTVAEICEKLKMNEKVLRTYGTPSQFKKASKKGNKVKLLIKLDDEEEKE